MAKFELYIKQYWIIITTFMLYYYNLFVVKFTTFLLRVEKYITKRIMHEPGKKNQVFDRENT